MGMFDNILKRHNESGEGGDSKYHKELLSRRARELIEELVSPLSKPNQKIIDEVLMIISQSATLPDDVINKSEVQAITKKLLFELVEPISNPNKMLIDELLAIVSGQPLKSSQVTDAEKPKSNIVYNQDNEEKDKYLKGHYALGEQKNAAMAEAPFPSDDGYKNQSESADDPQNASEGGGEKGSGNDAASAPKKKASVSSNKIDKETRSVMNLILEQIKELINITNNLNSKIKSHQVRLDTFESSINDLNKRSSEVDERMSAFEKNMEKFIGLYEVVTNQYNPFVESDDVYKGYPNDPSKAEKKEDELPSNAQNLSFGNSGEISMEKEEPKPVEVEETKPKELVVAQKDIRSVEDFADAMLLLDDAKFAQDVMDRKDEIVSYFKDELGEVEVSALIKDAKDRVSLTKDLMKAVHS